MKYVKLFEEFSESEELLPYAKDVWGLTFSDRTGENKQYDKEMYYTRTKGAQRSLKCRISIFFSTEENTAFVSNIENFTKGQENYDKGLAERCFILAIKLIISKNKTPTIDVWNTEKGYDMLESIAKKAILSKNLTR